MVLGELSKVDTRSRTGAAEGGAVRPGPMRFVPKRAQVELSKRGLKYCCCCSLDAVDAMVV